MTDAAPAFFDGGVKRRQVRIAEHWRGCLSPLIGHDLVRLRH
jgi:hypothetical protein